MEPNSCNCCFGIVFSDVILLVIKGLVIENSFGESGELLFARSKESNEFDDANLVLLSLLSLSLCEGIFFLRLNWNGCIANLHIISFTSSISEFCPFSSIFFAVTSILCVLSTSKLLEVMTSLSSLSSAVTSILCVLSTSKLLEVTTSLSSLSSDFSVIFGLASILWYFSETVPVDMSSSCSSLNSKELSRDTWTLWTLNSWLIWSREVAASVSGVGSLVSFPLWTFGSFNSSIIKLDAVDSSTVGLSNKVNFEKISFVNELLLKLTSTHLSFSESVVDFKYISVTGTSVKETTSESLLAFWLNGSYSGILRISFASVFSVGDGIWMILSKLKLVPCGNTIFSKLVVKRFGLCLLRALSIAFVISSFPFSSESFSHDSKISSLTS